MTGRLAASWINIVKPHALRCRRHLHWGESNDPDRCSFDTAAAAADDDDDDDNDDNQLMMMTVFVVMITDVLGWYDTSRSFHHLVGRYFICISPGGSTRQLTNQYRERQSTNTPNTDGSSLG